MALKIEDYGLIGDTHTAALVGADGSIDWLCLPNFAGGACFAALLGTPEHGRWLIAPQGEITARQRRYRSGTLVLESEFETADGAARVVDFMPPRQIHPHVVRLVEGIGGEVTMAMELVIRFEYGADVPWVRNVGGALHAIAGPNGLTLRTPVRTFGQNLRTHAEFKVAEHDRVPFVLTWHRSWEEPTRVIDAERALSDTTDYWTEWGRSISADAVKGPWEDQVRRSLITLKALTFAPTGGIVAAPTTSLPQKIGADRNWDYRQVWLRDAAYVLEALIQAGCGDEAEAWGWWLARAAAGAPEQLQVVYGVAGERHLTEIDLDWLPGYGGSRPVRIGSSISDTFQLDVYGALMFALDRARHLGLHQDREIWKVQRALMGFVEQHWSEPDEGMWSGRGPRRHFVHSKLMCWLAADRAVKAVARYGLTGPVERWRTLRTTIHDDICAKGYNARLGSFTQYYGAQQLDASVLLMILFGFLPVTDERVVSTMNAVERELVVDGLVRRYQSSARHDGQPLIEGAFFACSFWFADCLARMGRVDQAVEMFDRLIGMGNDVGLLSEVYDQDSARLLGNFPHALSHVALLNCAHELTRHLGSEPASG